MRPPNQSARNILTVVTVVAALGTVVSVAVYRYIRDAETARIEAEFERRSEVRHALTREIVNYYISGVYALKSLFEGSATVSRQEFRQVATDILARYPGIAALEWVPAIPAANRDAREAAISAELGQPFQFTQPGPDGSMVRARDRSEHYPIIYVEPMQGNERAFGYDVQNAPSYPFLEHSRRTRQMVATAPFDLVQSRRGFVMVWPVFHDGPAPGTPERFTGFVQGVFRLGEMLAQTEQRTPISATDVLYLDDTAASTGERFLHYQAGGKNGPNSVFTDAEFSGSLIREHSLEFGGRKWRVLYRATPAWLAEQSSLQPQFALGAGLLITVLLASLVTAMARRTAAIQQQVDERTAELSESRRQLDSLMQALPGMAYRCRYDRLLTVFYVSDGAVDLTGHEPTELISGRVQFRELIHPDDLSLVRERTLVALLQERGSFEVEYRIRTRDSREKWVLSRGRGVYDEAGKLQFFEGLAIDITARKQAETEKLAIERKLLESQKLESLGLLAGGIAHDFNNLLTGILGHASLARFRPGIDTETADHLRKIEVGAGRAAELCQQMLAYSGRGRFLVETTELGQLIRDTLPLLQGSLSSRSKLDLALAPEPTLILADATQIRQIVMNLIINASDALGPAGGDIVVTTGRRRFEQEFLRQTRLGDTLSPGEYVFLEVRDNGCGMSSETLNRIFDPFFTTKFTGRGLGLAAVLGIVRGHSGGLRVQSDLGLGSTFTLLLPPAKETRLTGSDYASATPWQRVGRILVIDDEGPVRDVAAELLRTFGFAVTTAVDGAEGISKFAREPAAFDLVFLDLTMPGLDGEETLAALRAIHPLVRVMLVSGYSENDRIAKLASEGPLVFMQKPFSRARLEQKIRELLG